MICAVRKIMKPTKKSSSKKKSTSTDKKSFPKRKNTMK